MRIYSQTELSLLVPQLRLVTKLNMKWKRSSDLGSTIVNNSTLSSGKDTRNMTHHGNQPNISSMLEMQSRLTRICNLLTFLQSHQFECSTRMTAPNSRSTK